MAPAALELLLLGLMHFALARLDIWHEKVLKMLLQSSGTLTAAAFLPSTPDWCSWGGQPLQLVSPQEGFRRLRPVFHSPPRRRVGFLPCSPPHVDKRLHQKVWCPHGAPARAGVGIAGSHRCLGAGGLAHEGRTPAFSGYTGRLLGS